MLRWIRQNQNNIRAEVIKVYEMLSIKCWTTNYITIILQVSRQDLTQRYKDGMAIVLNDGKPYIFLTMTCNPYWSEITF
ncbi:hypothetical protein Lal_00040009 [Lupinus albus]|nr:hypothetical protein Lal_00040009 [Lupinus albus]